MTIPEALEIIEKARNAGEEEEVDEEELAVAYELVNLEIQFDQ